MPGSQLPDLTTSGPIADADFMYLTQTGGVSRKTTFQALREKIMSYFPEIPPAIPGPAGPQGVPGTSEVAGLVVAPYGTSLGLVSASIDGHNHPRLFESYGYGEYDSELYLVRIESIIISTRYRYLGLTGITRLDMVEESGNVRVSITNGDEGGYTTVGYVDIPENTAGTYPVMESATGIVLAYITTTYQGLSLSALGTPFLFPYGSAFSIRRSVLGQALQEQTSIGRSWEFELNHLANWTSGGTVEVNVKLHNVDLIPETFSLICASSTSGDKSLKLLITVQYLGVKFYGGESFSHQFRTFVRAVSDGVLITNPNPTPKEGEVSINSFPSEDEAMWFDITTRTEVDSASTTSFGLLSAVCKSVPVYAPPT